MGSWGRGIVYFFRMTVQWRRDELLAWSVFQPRPCKVKSQSQCSGTFTQPAVTQSKNKCWLCAIRICIRPYFPLFGSLLIVILPSNITYWDVCIQYKSQASLSQVWGSPQEEVRGAALLFSSISLEVKYLPLHKREGNRWAVTAKWFQGTTCFYWNAKIYGSRIKIFTNEPTKPAKDIAAKVLFIPSSSAPASTSPMMSDLASLISW